MQAALALDVEALVGRVAAALGDLSGDDGVDVEFGAVWLAFGTLRLSGEGGEFFAQVENDGAVLGGGALCPCGISFDLRAWLDVAPGGLVLLLFEIPLGIRDAASG